MSWKARKRTHQLHGDDSAWQDYFLEPTNLPAHDCGCVVGLMIAHALISGQIYAQDMDEFLSQLKN